MEQIYVNSIKNDPENQCCYVVDYLIRRDKNLTDHIVLECEEQPRPELDKAIAAMPEFFCQLAGLRPFDAADPGNVSGLMHRVKFLKAARAEGKNGLKYSIWVKVYNHLLGKYMTIALTGIPANTLVKNNPFEKLFAEAELYAAGHRAQESLFNEEDEEADEEDDPKVIPLNQAS